MNQAQRIVSRFGSANRLAVLLSDAVGRPVYRSTVLRWCKPRTAGGTGGYVPPRWYRAILHVAKAEGLNLVDDDFKLVEVDDD